MDNKKLSKKLADVIEKNPIWGHVIISKRRVEDIKIEAAAGVSVKGGNQRGRVFFIFGKPGYWKPQD